MHKSPAIAANSVRTANASGPFTVVRFVLGVVFLTAAALKAFLPGKLDSTHTFLLGSVADEFRFAQIAFEALLGLWLLSGLHVRLLRHITIGTLCIFSAISLYQVSAQSNSCGCFGRFSPPPWSVFLFDVGALAAVLISSHPAGPAADGSTVSQRWIVPTTVIAPCILAISLIIGGFNIAGVLTDGGPKRLQYPQHA